MQSPSDKNHPSDNTPLLSLSQHEPSSLQKEIRLRGTSEEINLQATRDSMDTSIEASGTSLIGNDVSMWIR